MGTNPEHGEKGSAPQGKGPRGKRKKMRTRDVLWLAVSKVLGLTHKTNASGNNMSQR